MPHVDSYYASTLNAKSSFASLVGDIEVDVCVIGGGLAGLTTARELLGHGKSVALLEDKKVGWGASGRNGGFVSDGYAEGLQNLERKLGVEHAKTLFDISCEGTRYVRKNIAGFASPGQDPQFGWLNVSRHDVGDTLKRSVERQISVYGADVEFLDTSQVRQKLKSNRYFQGVTDNSSFHIHPLNYCVALAKDVADKGGKVFEGTSARTLHKHVGHFSVETANGQIKAANIVLCGSAYMRDLFPKVESAVLPVATYVVSTKKMKKQLETAIAFKGCIADSGRITTQKSEPKKLAQLLKNDIEAIYPQLEGLEIEKAWSGLMGYCAHKMPILAEMEPGIWAATGTGGHGLNTTAAIGIVVAEAIAGVSDRYKHFEPFKAQWTGGPIGRAAAQLTYWGMQMQDKWEESR